MTIHIFLFALACHAVTGKGRLERQRHRGVLRKGGGIRPLMSE